MSRPVLLFTIVGCAISAGIGFAVARSGALSGSDAPAPMRADEVPAHAREILADPDPLQRSARLAALLPRLGPEAVPALLEAFERAPLDGGDPELALLGTWWARFDPKAAIRWTLRDWRAGYVTVIAAVHRSWAHSEPREALASAQGLTFPGQSDLSVAAVIAGWDESGQPGLIEYVQQVQSSNAQQRVAEILARRRVVSLGVDGALHWLESLPEGAFREMMRSRVASAAAQVDPSRIVAWAEPQIANAKRPTGLPRRIGTRWVRSDPDAAFAWLASLPAGSDRDDGVAESFRTWMRHDLVGAHKWAAAAKLEPWSEPALAVYARVISTTRPEEALALAGRFSGEGLRHATTTVIAQQWLARDRAAADAWLKQADLPDDVRKRAYMARVGAGKKRHIDRADAVGEDDL